jgi:hypothetical protein
MPWVRLDDQFPDHPKVVSAGPLAGWLHVCGIAYCNRHLTDGFIPRAVAHRLANFEGIGVELGGDGKSFAFGEDASCEWMASVLCEHGLWDKVAGGYQIHDYLEFQPSKDEVLALRDARSEAGKLGGQASAKAKAQAKVKQEAKQNSSKIQPRTRTRTDKTKTLAPTPREPVDKPTSKNGRDELWDELERLFGKVAPKTNSHAKRNKACADLRRLGASPMALRHAYNRWPRLYPDANPTDIAIATHYPQLVERALRMASLVPPCPECGMGGGRHIADCSKVAA